MGLFDKKKVVAPNTTIKYHNNITDRLTSMLVPRFAKTTVYLQESGDPKFVNIKVEGLDEILGVITRDTKNIVNNIGIYSGRGFANALSLDAAEAVKVYLNRELDKVTNPY